MEDLESKRESYKPERIEVLFVGESPPQKGFFYSPEGSLLGEATKGAFEDAFQKAFKTYEEFLEFFKSQGCYLVDLLPGRGRNIELVRDEEREAAKSKLGELIAQHKPRMVVAVLRRICRHVRRAVEESGVKAEVRCLPFPRRFRGRYRRELAEIMASLKDRASRS